MYTIGQLSKATGVTVRTLHYYEELGLVLPATTSEAGYRYYDTSATLRLQQILVFKQLGFSLMQIKQLLLEQTAETQEHHWRSMLEQQLQAVHDEQQRLQKLESFLRSTLHVLKMKGTVEPDDVLTFIRSTQTDNKQQRAAFLAQHFQPHERAILQTLPRFDEDDPRTHEWVAIMRAVQDQMQLPPDTAAGQALARRIMECAYSWFHGNEALMERWWELVRPAAGEPAKIIGLEAEKIAYIDALLNVWYPSEEHPIHE